MNVKRSFYIIIAALAALFLLAIALSAKFSLTSITADPYGFMTKFLEIWAPAAGAIGTIIVAIVIIFLLSYIRQTQEKDREQSIHALHDEIDINLSVIKTLRHRIENTLEPYDMEFRLGLTAQDRHLLFENIDTIVFDNMKNAGNLRWLNTARKDVISCYTLIKHYNSDQSFQESHPQLLSKIITQLQRAQRKIEDTFEFLPVYTREKRVKVKSDIEEDQVLAP
jgi:uncharacterized membrane protein